MAESAGASGVTAELAVLRATAADQAAVIEGLTGELAALRATVIDQTALIERLTAENAELRARLASNSKNSSKPPSSDGYTKPAPKSRRTRSGKRPGKQPGDPGRHLAAVADPDTVVTHQPERCRGCGDDLGDAAVVGDVRRQVFDLPPVAPVVTEHRGERRRCGCGCVTTAEFPADATAPTCYGPRLRALVCYLVVRQHIPVARVAELLADTYRIPASTGTIIAMVRDGAGMLDDWLTSITDQLAAADVVHVDETGLRVDASLWWVHSASNQHATLYHLDRRRGTTAIDAMGIIANSHGTIVHDGWAPYRSYTGVTHALCNAHHLRELDAVAGLDGQAWATDMIALLADTWHHVLDTRTTGATTLDADTVAGIRTAYDLIIAAGHAANPPPPPSPRRGRTRKTKAANLLARLDRYADDVLRFTNDFAVAFDNNEAERQIRMVKIQQKISGGFRTATGATAWLNLRSYLATALKHDINPLAALQQLTTTNPWTPGAPTPLNNS